MTHKELQAAVSKTKIMVGLGRRSVYIRKETELFSYWISKGILFANFEEELLQIYISDLVPGLRLEYVIEVCMIHGEESIPLEVTRMENERHWFAGTVHFKANVLVSTFSLQILISNSEAQTFDCSIFTIIVI
jgi:hypothetical protein